MNKKKFTKLLALYLPYLVIGLAATNLGEAWRLAEGKELGDRIVSLIDTLPAAFANPLPSLHPLDILVGMYSAEDRDIRGAEQDYKKLEKELDKKIKRTPTDHSGYNEYQYHLDPIEHTFTTYYVTFQVESGDRMELTVSGPDYGMLVEGDIGKLSFQGTRYLGFERS